jgi:hypothetical protein
MNMKVGCREIHSCAIALVAILCLSYLAVPLAVQASQSGSGDPAPQGYQTVGNGVFESTFTRNVGGIQGAAHVIVVTPTGIHVSGWI